MHVVGISLGGMVALHLELDAPEMVRSLCVVNSAPEVSVRTLRQHPRAAGLESAQPPEGNQLPDTGGLG